MEDHSPHHQEDTTHQEATTSPHPQGSHPARATTSHPTQPTQHTPHTPQGPMRDPLTTGVILHPLLMGLGGLGVMLVRGDMAPVPITIESVSSTNVSRGNDCTTGYLRKLTIGYFFDHYYSLSCLLCCLLCIQPW